MNCNEINGSSGNDTRSGEDGADCIDGRGGNDFLRGRNGRDTIDGGAGNDRLRGNDGNDSLSGGGGDDRLWGDDGNDRLRGNSGEDRFYFNDIDRVNHLGGRRYQVITADQGVDTVEDLNEASQGDNLFNNSNVWLVGNMGWNSDGGSSGVGNGDMTNSLLFAQTRELYTPLNPLPILGSSVKYQLASADDPSLRFQARSNDDIGQPVENSETAVFEITPTSSFKFTAEVFDVFQSDQQTKDVEIEQSPTVGFTQVVIVSLDDEAPESTRIFGDDSNEVLRGNAMDDIGDAVDDVILGLGGNDTLRGRGGRDIALGGSGRDRIFGELGDDSLYGNSGGDYVNGGVGNDLINGGEGRDTLRGDAENDTILGWTDDDRIIGGTGQDSLKGEYGNDTVLGGDGNDTLSGGFGSNILNGGAGQDLIVESGTDFILTNTLLTGLGQAVLNSIEAASLSGLASDDLIDASLFSMGDVSLNGGDGNDTLLGGEGSDELRGGAYGDDSIVGGDGNDTLVGDFGDDTLEGGLGSDLLNGGNGNDSLHGGSGNDTLNGWIDDDTLHGGARNDQLSGGAGNDDIHGGSGQDTLIESANLISGNIILTDTSLSGFGLDQLSSVERVNINILGGANTSINALEFSGLTTLAGNNGDNLIAGGSGHDRISGSNGNDILGGNAGDDLLIGGRDNDLLAGGLGNDTLNGTTYAHGGEGEQDVLDGGNGNNQTEFILGDTNSVGRSPKVFYDGSNSDFALINNFDVKNSGGETAFDIIQLAGEASDYILLELNTGETQIRLGSNLQGSLLIARVNILGNGDLDLNNSEHFRFVDTLGIGS